MLLSAFEVYIIISPVHSLTIWHHFQVHAHHARGYFAFGDPNQIGALSQLSVHLNDYFDTQLHCAIFLGLCSNTTSICR